MPRARTEPQTNIRALDRNECEHILSRHQVGRLAFAFHDQVDIEPIHYVMLEGDLLFRTAPGSKIDVLKHHPWVAFEVDEVEGLLEWRSVVVHGTIYHLDEGGTPADRALFASAADRLRDLIPPAQRTSDPLSFRPIILRLFVDTMTGREAQAARSKAPRRKSRS